ncbi:BPSL0761 family protein [Pseudomonas sp. CR3202]|uniref:BPSL0761 family protein n=1 Tax=Pseudomonas sp. CR3202 TaxID=3351532 RepID=UPI003BF436E7
MNLPDRRTQSVFQTWDFLIGLTRDTDLPEEVRQEVNWLLRHYPYALHGDVSLRGKPDAREPVQ